MKKYGEELAVMAWMAFMGAVGSLFLICALTDVDLVKLGAGTAAGFLCGFFGVLFALFLFFHHKELH